MAVFANMISSGIIIFEISRCLQKKDTYSVTKSARILTLSIQDKLVNKFKLRKNLSLIILFSGLNEVASFLLRASYGILLH